MSEPSKRESAVPEVTEEQRQRMLYKKLLRRKRRKEREAAGEISDLNLTPMMDMMTIILVFLLKSYSATGINMAASGDIAPPVSNTRLAPKDTISVTVTRCAPGNERGCRPGQGHVFVMDKQILSYDDDKISGQLKDGGDNGMLVLPLLEALRKEVDKVKFIAKYNSAVQFTGELSVIADRKMPYRMLTEVLYTAGQAELDSYRFVVIKAEGAEEGGHGEG
ncbi:MAG: ExbD/TolR family protein [Myxococcales bacterium]|jgi:biopolymer transport protein ExbD